MRLHRPPIIVRLTALFGAALLLAGCGGGSDGGSDGGGDSAGGGLEDMEPVVLRVAIPLPETATPSLGMQAFADYASEASDGKLDFEFHYNATLIPGAELLPGLSSGLADIGLIISAYQPELLPTSAWMAQHAPRIENWGFPKQTIDQAIQARLLFGNEVLREEQAAQNTVPLWGTPSGPYSMLCAEPFTTPEDLAGRQVRVGGEPWATEVTELGMTPAFLPSGETYEALQRGILDCTETDPQTITTQGLMEVGKHLSPINGSQAAVAQLAMNKDSYDALPLEAQQILFDAKVPAMIAFAQGTMDSWKDMFTQAEEMGVTIVPPGEIDELLRENQEAYGEKVAASPPSVLEDPDALVKEYEEIADEYSALWDERVGVEPVDKSDLEAALEGYQMGSEGIDWEEYEAVITELIAPVRP
jgi:TRAP-type C4-dicarboxylate transport system substrate-binding protein